MVSQSLSLSIALISLADEDTISCSVLFQVIISKTTVQSSFVSYNPFQPCKLVVAPTRTDGWVSFGEGHIVGIELGRRGGVAAAAAHGGIEQFS